MFLRSFRIVILIFLASSIGAAQTKEASVLPKPAASNSSEKIPPKSAREIEAERLLKERRANAQSLLISLAAGRRLRQGRQFGPELSKRSAMRERRDRDS